MAKEIKIREKKYPLPIYLPDATRAVVKSVDSVDLKNVGVEGVVVNTYHLMTQPGMTVLKKLGGIKKLMNFDGLVVSDSGGWQIFSLLHRRKERSREAGEGAGVGGEITDEGVLFSLNNKKKEIFTPEKSIEVQFDIGSDIIICLDDFTSPKATQKEIEASVERTILWAKRSRVEFDRQIKRRKLDDQNRPHLFAVIQGGWDKELRKYCAKELLKIGFDGYGYGGYTVTEKGEQDLTMAKYVVELIPDQFPKFALGSGKPSDIVRLNELGWDIFDCVLPTRDGRHKRLYNFKREMKSTQKSTQDLADPKNYDYLYIQRGKYADDEKPISSFCDCPACQKFSRAYLHHLFKIDDFSSHRLATMHNLRLYTKIIQMLRVNDK